MTLNEVKQRIKETPISSIIGNFVSLTPRGHGQFIAICPFHQDTHPSMHIHDSKGLFKCFACDVGGDAITFVEKYANLGFIESIQEIGKLLGIATDDLLQDNKNKNPNWDIAIWLLKKAANLYKSYAEHPQLSAPFQKFITDRKIEKPMQERFLLGLAPTHNPISTMIESITSEVKKQKLRDIALEIGLIREGLYNKRGQGKYFDVFRERIMFPIQDYFGHIVGFGSRAIHSYQKAKYLNSKDSFIFNKKTILYGLNLSKSAIKEKNQVILSEGYMDVITMHQNGFNNTIAIMGTALNQRSWEQIKNLTSNFILAFDSDMAGLTASEKAHTELVKNGVVAKYLDFTPAKDPDEFLNQFGPQKLQEKIDYSPIFISFLIDKEINSNHFEDLSQKQEVLHKIYRYLAPLKDSLLATEKIIQVAEKLEIKTSSDHLIQNYKQFLLGSKEKLIPPKPQIKIKKVDIKKKIDVLSRLEKSLIRELLLHPALMGNEEIQLLLENVVQNEVNRMFQWLKGLYYEIGEEDYVSTVMNYISKEQFSSDLRSIVGSTLYQFRQGLISDTEKLAKKLSRDFQTQMNREKLIAKKQQLVEQQKEIVDKEKNREIMSQLASLQKEINKLSHI